MCNDANVGKITYDNLKWFIDCMQKAGNYDADVASARRDGEVKGRNANIEEKMRKSKNETDGMPSLGGQSGTARGREIKRGTADGSNIGSGIWSAGNMKRNNY